MENLLLERSKFTMSVDFNAETGVLSLVGNSYPEDAISFFEPLNKWMEKYIEETKGDIIFNVKLNYLNSSSSKCFMDMFDILEDYVEDGGKVKVNWYYFENDDEVMEAGEELLEDLSLDYELIEYSEEE
ncbi:MAG: DUF1987 domain-containing protein [Candidatus Cloacimonetes bacterium]|jgi:hypothetical protein|nr:DUF1987 domain-containing protein [Candidatus Cloacimonadota bacterium]MDD4156301.1 DUF1987 domain-containing protein [Candidatus Cloacimonadota bacterium]